MTARVSATLCTRLMACCTRVSKSWTPRLTRLKPNCASIATSPSWTWRGSSSIEKSRSATRLLLAEVLTELRRGRIRGVPGAGGVVATQHPDIENWLRAHRPQVGPGAGDCLSWKAAPDPHRHRGSSVL